MKAKWILRVVAGLTVVLIVLFVALAFSLGAIVKRELLTIGPSAAKVDIKLKNAEVWLFVARVRLTGLVIGNPEGCKTPSAITVDDISVRVKPSTAFSSKLEVESIELKAPVITLEGGLRNNNLTTIEKNLDDYVGSAPTAPATNSSAAPSSPANSERKLQIDDLTITGAKLQVNTRFTARRTLTLPVPEIHLTALGTGSEGITPAELAQRVLRAIEAEAEQAIIKNAGSLGAEALGEAKGAAGKINVKKMTDKLKGLFQ